MSLRLYESIFILSPQISNEKIDSVIKQVEGMIVEHEGNLLKTEKWGLKKLAYLVKKFSDGFYLYFLYEAKPGTAKEIETKLKFDEEILRFLSVGVEKAREADTRKKAAEKPQPPEQKPAPEPAAAAAPAAARETIMERLSKVDLVSEEEEEGNADKAGKKKGDITAETVEPDGKAEKAPSENTGLKDPEESKDV